MLLRQQTPLLNAPMLWHHCNSKGSYDLYTVFFVYGFFLSCFIVLPNPPSMHATDQHHVWWWVPSRYTGTVVPVCTVQVSILSKHHHSRAPAPSTKRRYSWCNLGLPVSPIVILDHSGASMLRLGPRAFWRTGGRSRSRRSSVTSIRLELRCQKLKEGKIVFIFVSSYLNHWDHFVLK